MSRVAAPSSSSSAPQGPQTPDRSVASANAAPPPDVAPGADAAGAAVRSSAWRVHRGVILTAVSVFVVDHITKFLSIWYLPRDQYGDGIPVTVIPGCFSLKYAYNTGAAFSMFSDNTGILAIVSLVISSILVVWYLRTPAHWKITRYALALVLGGAVGNLVDRAFRGHVVDMFLAYYKTYYYPVFNVADSAICIGIGMLLLLTHREQSRE